MSDPTRASRQLTATETRAPAESESAGFFEIRVPGRAVPVRIEYAAIRALRTQLNSGSDYIGLLLGSSSREALSIQRCELLTLSAATLGDPKSLQGAFRQFIKARSQNPMNGAPELVGCFRSQAGGWPGMKDGDVEIVKQNFAGTNQLFLSIRTPQHRPWLAALYALDSKSASREPVSEFPFDEYLLRNGYLTDLMEATETDDDPEESGLALHNRRRWTIAALIVAILAVGSAAYKFKSKWYRPISGIEAIASSGSSSSPVATGILSLKVTRSEKDFEVSWDRLSPAVQQSSSGKLTINDGALTRTVELSGSQLREGHILYTPLFDELTFRLEVTTPDQGASAESVQVLAWSGKQPPDLMALASSQPPVSKAARPPARIPPVQPSAPPVALRPTPVPSPKTALPAAPAAKTPASNTQPPEPVQPPKSSAITESARVIPPANPERPPTQQSTPQAPPSTPPSQPPAAVQPTPEPPPIRQSVAPAPSASTSTTPAPQPSSAPPPAPSAPSAPPSAQAPKAIPSSLVTPPVPIQRATPALPRNVAPAGSPHVTAISIRAMIDSSGSVQSAQIISSTPKGIFGEAVIQKAALEAAKKWKFQPSQSNGKNVAGEYTIDFKFQ